MVAFISLQIFEKKKAKKKKKIKVRQRMQEF